MSTRMLMIAAAGLVFAAGAVLAQGGKGPSDRSFTASLAGNKEVPPTFSTGSGTVEGLIDMSSRELRWTVKCSGLTGPVTAMHFHGPAAEGQNAGVVVPIQGSCDGQGAMGKMVIDQNQLADMLAGKWYVNVHTQRFPGGEIRGQVTVAR